MGWSLDIVQSASARDIFAVQELWAEYWQSLGLSLDFQDFAEELRTLPGKYAPPAGRPLLVRIDGRPAGTPSFRPPRPDARAGKPPHLRPPIRGVVSPLLPHWPAPTVIQ